jgi:hypothetical protein
MAVFSPFHGMGFTVPVVKVTAKHRLLCSNLRRQVEGYPARFAGFCIGFSQHNAPSFPFLGHQNVTKTSSFGTGHRCEVTPRQLCPPFSWQVIVLDRAAACGNFQTTATGFSTILSILSFNGKQKKAIFNSSLNVFIYPIVTAISDYPITLFTSDLIGPSYRWTIMTGDWE